MGFGPHRCRSTGSAIGATVRAAGSRAGREGGEECAGDEEQPGAVIAGKGIGWVWWCGEERDGEGDPKVPPNWRTAWRVAPSVPTRCEGRAWATTVDNSRDDGARIMFRAR